MKLSFDEVVDLLESNLVEVSFIKRDGTERIMQATRNIEIASEVGAGNSTLKNREIERKSGLISVVDYELGETRIVNYNTLNWVKVLRSSDNSNTMESEYVVIDVETTGLDFKSDRIIEIAMVRINDSEILESVSYLINPERKLPDKIKELTGLTDKDLEDKPVFSEVCDDILDFIGDNMIIAHNAQFDTKFLRAELRRCGVEIPNSSYCTYQLSRNMLKAKSNKLTDLCKELGIHLENEHRALDDATATAHLFFRLFPQM